MVSRPDVINQFLCCFSNPTYLEVGVSEGETFFVTKASRKVAVDPKFRFDVDQAREDNPNSEFYEVTSDFYFGNLLKETDMFDVVYLDGLHTFEQTLRDFTNAIRYCSADGVIIVDDVVPNSYQSGLPSEAHSVQVKEFIGDPDHSWMGDTYKLVFFIEAFFPTFELRTISDNHGQAVIWRASRPRKSFKTYSARNIADLEFLDVVIDKKIFNRKTCADIVAEFKSTRVRQIKRIVD